MKRRRSDTIDLPDGSVTPGWMDTRELVAELPWNLVDVGVRCLDAGTWDGFWAFEPERRGAEEILAIDVTGPTGLDWKLDHRNTGPAQPAGVIARRPGRSGTLTKAFVATPRSADPG